MLVFMKLYIRAPWAKLHRLIGVMNVTEHNNNLIPHVYAHVCYFYDVKLLNVVITFNEQAHNAEDHFRHFIMLKKS